MIPLKLQLANFLSYRQTVELDLRGVHLACISGLNGAGKSSLLDAMTWALFGKSRAKSDDEVVNRLAAAQGDMAEVHLIFKLETAVYRIIRRKKPGKTMELEFQIAETADEALDALRWKTLSEGRLRETQAAIERALNMSYDIFTNASFLLQGQADEFTTKTPGKRKEILADLLGVSRWEAYRETAAERRRETEAERALCDGRMAEIETELAGQPERAAELAAAQEALGRISQQRDTQEKLVQQMRQVETAVKQQSQTVKNLANAAESLQGRLARQRQSQAERQKERAAHQALLDEAETITANFAQWQEADAARRAWQEKAEGHNVIQQAKRPFELAVERERSRLEQRRQGLETQAESVAAMRQERGERQAEIESAGQRLDAIGAELAVLAEQEAAYHDARAGLQELHSQRQLIEQEHRQLKERDERAKKLAVEREAVAANLAQAEAALERLTVQAAAVAEDRQRLSAAQGEQRALEAEQPRLHGAMDKLSERIGRLEEEGDEDQCPLCGQPLTAEHREEVLAELRMEGGEMGDAFRGNKARIQELGQTIKQLEERIRRNGRSEQDLALQQQRKAKAQARLDEIDRSLAEWGSEDEEKLAKLEAQLADQSLVAAKEKEIAALAEALKAKGPLEEERQARQRVLSSAEARLAQIKQAVESWESEGQAALTAVREQLEGGDYAAEAQQELAALDAGAAELGYDADAHAAARQAAAALADAPDRHGALQQAEAAVKPLDAALAEGAEQIAEREAELADLETQHAEASASLAALQADGGDLKTAEDELQTLREAAVNANRQVGAAQQRLDVLADRRRQRKELRRERAEITRQIQRLKLLEKACSRKGIQALLIEQALPEIEESANELLDRLTGGKMQVQFDTQRQLKSRDALAETLDINIRDDAGERPYENFSGGEQFRVNFAIRLALSRILARRAGARLQTLVIDEGFGSQDPNGRQRLVEAINTIQDDFARILVITHIDELRDAFPNRIEVEKTPSGSTLVVY